MWPLQGVIVSLLSGETSQERRLLCRTGIKCVKGWSVMFEFGIRSLGRLAEPWSIGGGLMSWLSKFFDISYQVSCSLVYCSCTGYGMYIVSGGLISLD